MKVKLDKTIFTTGVSDKVGISYLILLSTYKGRHQLMVDFDPTKTNGCVNLSSIEQEILNQAFLNVQISCDKSYNCEVTARTQEDEKKIFTVDEGIRYLMQPISILVENSLNDAYFVRALFRCIDSTKRLKDLDKDHFIQFENLGGCSNVRNFIESRIQFFGGKTKFLNCFVLFDGDRTNPSDCPHKYTDIKKFLRSCHVEYHILEKRCMENYMPDEAMKSFRTSKNSEWLDSYLALTPQQKDFIDFSKGFLKDVTQEIEDKVKIALNSNQKSNKRRSKVKERKTRNRGKSIYRSFLPQTIKDFYSNVPDTDYKRLEGPFIIGKNFKTEFPKKFEDAVFVYKKNLLQRTSHQQSSDELQKIVEKILKLA